MKLLLLGGTSDARRLAEVFIRRDIAFIYSVAGLVRHPSLNCAVVSGGFSQFGGLSSYIGQNQITAVLDATHPYAVNMSHSARQSCLQCGIDYWRFERQPWQKQQDDNWIEFNDWSDIYPQLANMRRVLITVGQLSQDIVIHLTGLCQETDKKFIVRTAVAANVALPPSITWLQAIGPFQLADELTLFDQFKVDAMVSKNSGGIATMAKLTAARQRNVSVFMQQRPRQVEANKRFYETEQCVQFILAQSRQLSH